MSKIEELDKKWKQYFKTEAGKNLFDKIQRIINSEGVKKGVEEYAGKRKILSDVISINKGWFEKETGISVIEKRFLYDFFFKKHGPLSIQEFTKMEPEKFREDLSEYVREQMQKNKNLLSDKPKQNKCSSLKEIFVSIDVYTDTMALLSDEDLTDKDSGLWIDKSKGYKGKIVALLNDLAYKGYYKINSVPGPEILMSIAKNTFGVAISKRMFHSDNIPDLRRDYFYFIEKYQPN